MPSTLSSCEQNIRKSYNKWKERQIPVSKCDYLQIKIKTQVYAIIFYENTKQKWVVTIA